MSEQVHLLDQRARHLNAGTAVNGYGGTDTLQGITNVLLGSDASGLADGNDDTFAIDGNSSTLQGGSGSEVDDASRVRVTLVLTPSPPFPSRRHVKSGFKFKCSDNG